MKITTCFAIATFIALPAALMPGPAAQAFAAAAAEPPPAATGPGMIELVPPKARTPDAEAPDAAAPKKRLVIDPKKTYTLEELSELPVLKRYDIPWEKGEQMLGDVKDNTFGYDESAFYWLVDLVSKMPPELMKPDAETQPYKALLALPSSFRGHPVTLSGVYMTVSPIRTPVLALRKDVPVLYEVNIREAPLEEVRPLATVIVIEDPMTYIKAFDTVKVKGYFYKIRAYQGEKGEGFAPMLIGRRIELDEGSPMSLRMGGTAMSGEQILLAVMIGGIILMAVAFFFIRQRTKAKANATSGRPIHKFRLHRPDRLEPPAPPGPGGEGGGPKP